MFYVFVHTNILAPRDARIVLRLCLCELTLYVQAGWLLAAWCVCVRPLLMLLVSPCMSELVVGCTQRSGLGEIIGAMVGWAIGQ